MKNIHVLSTDKPSEFYSIDGKHKLANSTMAMDWYISSVGYKPHNIYITSDEKFVRDEYITDGIEVNKAFPKLVDAQGLVNRRNWRKIILTTDQDLIKDGVQAIDDEFLEWFVKNPNCEKVEIERWFDTSHIDLGVGKVYHNNPNMPLYKIIIPKEEPKQETLEEKLESLVVQWHQQQLQYEALAEKHKENEHNFKKFTYKAMATRDCWKELLTLLNLHKDEK